MSLIKVPLERALRRGKVYDFHSGWMSMGFAFKCKADCRWGSPCPGTGHFSCAQSLWWGLNMTSMCWLRQLPLPSSLTARMCPQTALSHLGPELLL